MKDPPAFGRAFVPLGDRSPETGAGRWTDPLARRNPHRVENRAARRGFEQEDRM